MRINEILSEEVGDEGADVFAVNTVTSILSFLINRAKDIDVEASLKTDTLLDLIKKAGLDYMTYDTLLYMSKEVPVIKNMISSVDEDDTVLNINDEMPLDNSDISNDDENGEMEDFEKDSDHMLDDDDRDISHDDSDDDLFLNDENDISDSENSEKYTPPSSDDVVDDNFRPIRPSNPSIVRKMANDARRNR